MINKAVLSRRAALVSLAVSPLLANAMPATVAPSADAHLLTLGRDFSLAAAELDRAIANGGDGDPSWPLLEKFAQLESAIVATQAVTMEGLCVKARAACWARLGDLDDCATGGERMALSIVRDLIRLYDPNLERPGALTQLVKDIESGAGNSVRPSAKSHKPNMECV
jgi:hypothetical protein